MARLFSGLRAKRKNKMFIDDGKGKGTLAAVNNSNQLHVVAESHSRQHHESLHEGAAYQVIGDFASVSGSANNILHLKNTSSTHRMMITYIRVEMAGAAGGAFGAATYFSIGHGLEYTSGGTIAVPVNVNLSSGNTAVADVYDNNPTLGGTFVEFDRWYPDANQKMMSFNKEGAVILGQNDAITVRCVTDHTSGTAYARISFVYVQADE
jgi:hypothetical protein